MKTRKITAYGLIAVIFALALTTCDSDSGGDKPQTVTYTGKSDGATYTLIITENTARYAAQIGDAYELTVGAKKSTGTVSIVTGVVLTLKPSNSSVTFTVTIAEGNKLTELSGTITWTDTTTEPAPGALNDPTHTHEWGAWQSDATGHWKECTAHDGAKTDIANHMGNPCTVCGYTATTDPNCECPNESDHWEGEACCLNNGGSKTDDCDCKTVAKATGEHVANTQRYEGEDDSCYVTFNGQSVKRPGDNCVVIGPRPIPDHTGTINAFGKDATVTGAGSIPKADFDAAVDNLRDTLFAMDVYFNGLPLPHKNQLTNMMDRGITIVAGNAVPSGAGGALTVGVGYLKSNETDVIENDLLDLLDANAFTMVRSAVKVRLASVGASSQHLKQTVNPKKLRVRERRAKIA